MRGRHTRTDATGVDPAAVKMRRRVGGEMPATHTHGAAAEMGRATTHTHGAAAKVSSATPTAEVAATTAAAAAAETAASCVSSRRQTKGNGYCGGACRDFPHDTPRQGQI